MQNSESKKAWKLVALELFVLSAVSLYLEVLFIRWFSADVRAFSAFRTFPLVSCFVGLGIGFALGKDRLFGLTPVFLLISVFSIKALEFLGISLIPFPTSSITAWEELSAHGASLWLLVVVIAQILFLLLIGPFASMVCIGERLGVLFNKLEPIKAYCINIGGAMLGSVILTVLSFKEVPPNLELIPALVVIIALMLRGKKLALATAVVSSVAMIFISLQTNPIATNGETIWTPYQRLDLLPINSKQGVIGYNLLSNRVPLQTALDLSEKGIKNLQEYGKVQPGLANALRRYELPYKIAPSVENVLIVGSGLGNDVSTALRYGAGSIDAVELDPSILKLGMTRNTARPYDSPKVHAFCDDARHFFDVTTNKYDVIVFSHLDSGYVVGQGSSSRVDNYVYTRESIGRALTLLKPKGLLVLSYFAVKPWFNDRLFLTTSAAAGYHPLEFADVRDTTFANTEFVLGETVKTNTFKLPKSISDFSKAPMHGDESVRLLTDDWPFLYVTPGMLDFPYLFVLGETLLIAWLLSRRFLKRLPKGQGTQMFFLGSGFLLLELQAISRLARLFGSTWLTSALVINGVLLMILFANMVVIRKSEFLGKKVDVLYVLLILSLLGSFAMPVNELLATMPNGAVLIGFVTVLPMFFAAMIFGISFSKVENASSALAYNMFGAVLGALLEYASNYIGIKNLVLIALFLYLCSWGGLRQQNSQRESP